MKKVGVILIFLLVLTSLFVFPNFVSAEDKLGRDIPVETFADSFNNSASRWDYLTKEWKNIILSNPVAYGINLSFEKISFVFKILIGEEYSLSISIWVIILMWLLIALKAAELFRISKLLKGKFSYLGGFAIAIILAHLQIYRILYDFVGDLWNSEKLWWVRILIVIVIVALVLLVNYVNGILKKFLNDLDTKAKNQQAEEIAKLAEKHDKELQEIKADYKKAKKDAEDEVDNIKQGYDDSLASD